MKKFYTDDYPRASFFGISWMQIWLVIWLPCFIFPYIGNVILPIDFHIFQRAGPTTNQMSVKQKELSDGQLAEMFWKWPRLSILSTFLIISTLLDLAWVAWSARCAGWVVMAWVFWDKWGQVKVGHHGVCIRFIIQIDNLTEKNYKKIYIYTQIVEGLYCQLP